VRAPALGDDGRRARAAPLLLGPLEVLRHDSSPDRRGGGTGHLRSLHFGKG
jgi:hypothetical protein